MAHRFYNCSRWLNLRALILSEQPLCRHCEVRGLTEIATEVDHIIPIIEGGNPTSRENLQPLCASCHSRKTRGENQPEKAITTTLGYADTTITEKVVTKKATKGRKRYSEDNEPDYNDRGHGVQL